MATPILAGPGGFRRPKWSRKHMDYRGCVCGVGVTRPRRKLARNQPATSAREFVMSISYEGNGGHIFGIGVDPEFQDALGLLDRKGFVLDRPHVAELSPVHSKNVFPHRI